MEFGKNRNVISPFAIRFNAWLNRKDIAYQREALGDPFSNKTLRVLALKFINDDSSVNIGSDNLISNARLMWGQKARNTRAENKRVRDARKLRKAKQKPYADEQGEFKF